MKTRSIFVVALILLLTGAVAAGPIHHTAVAKVLEHSTSLDLTNSQVKKLQIIEDTAAQKMSEAKLHADILLHEIEQFTANWTNMNGTAVRSLLKEYYDYMTEYKSAELNAIIQARTILDFNQLTRFQQLESMESLILNMESDIALR